jgi:hypothetical protein
MNILNKPFTFKPTSRLTLTLAVSLSLSLSLLAPVQAQTLPTGAAQAPSCRVKDAELQQRFVGQCDAAGWAHGLGTAKGSNAIYTGEFSHGEKQGYGIKQWLSTGDRYIGQFKADFRDGMGVYVWGDNSSLKGYQYTGQFKHDKRDGQGIFDWANGESYAGQWVNDVQLDGYTPAQFLQAQALKAKSWQPVVAPALVPSAPKP